MSSELSGPKLLSSRKNKLIFAAVATVVTALVGLLVYSIVVTPERQPYRDALAQYKNVYNANVNVITAGSSLNATTASDGEFTQSTERVKTALTTLEQENDALGKKEVLQDGEGKRLYEALNSKIEEYVDYNNDMITSMQKVRPVVYACLQQVSAVEEGQSGVAAMRSCAADLRALATVPNKDYQALVVSSSKVYADFANSLEANGTQASAVSAEQERIVEELNTVSRTFSANINKNKQAIDITDAAIAVDEYLRKKSSIFG